jgi:CTP:molybdopterin cytidylyltransferase MocA
MIVASSVMSHAAATIGQSARVRRRLSRHPAMNECNQRPPRDRIGSRFYTKTRRGVAVFLGPHRGFSPFHYPLTVEPTAGLILAAGLGTRFGGRKLLAPVRGKPMLQHVLDLSADADLDPVVVVLGTDADELLAACTWRDEIIALNSRPADGLAGSVRLGLAALSGTASSRAVVLLADQPFLTRQQLAAVMRAPGGIVVPRFNGKPGNPVVLDRSVWPLAAQLEGDRGFSQLFAGQPALVTYIDVAGANPDIDSTDDLATLNRA